MSHSKAHDHAADVCWHNHSRIHCAGLIWVKPSEEAAGKAAGSASTAVDTSDIPILPEIDVRLSVLTRLVRTMLTILLHTMLHRHWCHVPAVDLLHLPPAVAASPSIWIANAAASITLRFVAQFVLLFHERHLENVSQVSLPHIAAFVSIAKYPHAVV